MYKGYITYFNSIRRALELQQDSFIHRKALQKYINLVLTFLHSLKHILFGFVFYIIFVFFLAMCYFFILWSVILNIQTIKFEK